MVTGAKHSHQTLFSFHATFSQTRVQQKPLCAGASMQIETAVVRKQAVRSVWKNSRWKLRVRTKLSSGSSAPACATSTAFARINTYFFALLALLCVSAPTLAHHSFAMYDSSKTLTFKGAVKAFQWTNPHVILWVMVQPEGGGSAEEWSLETTSPGNLTRIGWSRTSVKPGDRVSVALHPLRDGRHAGSLQSVTLLDTGKTLVPVLGPSTLGTTKK